MENQIPNTQAKPLSLVDMTSAFVVLGLGISLSSLVFSLELIYELVVARISSQKNKKSGISISQTTINESPTAENELKFSINEKNASSIVVTDVQE